MTINEALDLPMADGATVLDHLVAIEKVLVKNNCACFFAAFDTDGRARTLYPAAMKDGIVRWLDAMREAMEKPMKEIRIGGSVQ